MTKQSPDIASDSDSNLRQVDYVALAKSMGLDRVLYGVEEVATILGRSRDFVDDCITRGDLVATKLSGRVHVLAIEIARFLHRGTIDPATRKASKPRDFYPRKPKPTQATQKRKPKREPRFRTPGGESC
jgi:hypothetical protein